MNLSDIKKFGFGFMRLPTKSDGEIDKTQVIKMVDKYMSCGYNYFDTAYNYMENKSEDILRETVVERYPRDTFLVADKMPMWEVDNKSDLEKVFNTQLKRTGAKYFDYYLLHAVNKDIYNKSQELGAWKFLVKKKEEGFIKHLGFSFHDSANVLKEILNQYVEAEFVQLQINYIDWDSEAIQARKCYEIAKNYNKKIIVMEPIKGGSLSNLSNKSRDILNKCEPNWSLPKWAMNFVMSKDVDLVLSGVSNINQLEENIDIFDNINDLGSNHIQAIDDVVEYLLSIPIIACTSCKYCIEGCPSNIPIPDIIKVLNNYKTYGNLSGPKKTYGWITDGLGKASDCIECGQCEDHCPQHLEIIKAMNEACKAFEQ